MKLLLLLCVIFLVSSLETKSQTTDTLCFPVPVIQKVLIAAKQKQVQDTLINILRSDISELTSIRVQFEGKDSTNKLIIGAMEEQKKVLEGQITSLNKELKKQKRKTKWTAIGGIVLSAATAFLFIIK